MTVLGLLFVAAVLFLVAATAYRLAPSSAVQTARIAAGTLLLGAALWALVARRVGVALGLGGLAAALLGPVVAARRGSPSPGGSSEARTDRVVMTLHHDAGEMDGHVLAGRFAGRRLSELAPEELQALFEEAEDDEETTALLTAYLSRRGEGAGEPPPRDPAHLSEEEAYRILGLAPGASIDEVRAAHRRLIRKVHPDLGGSPALAALLNAAKNRLDRGPT